MGHKNQLKGTVESLNPLMVRTVLGLLQCSDAFGELRVGQLVTLVLPSSAAEIADSGVNILSGEVRHVQFQGAGFLISLRFADASDFAFTFNRSCRLVCRSRWASNRSPSCAMLEEIMSEEFTIIKNDAAGQEVWRYPGRLIARSDKGLLFEAFFNRPIFASTVCC
jgi:hypothetical protein